MSSFSTLFLLLILMITPMQASGQVRPRCLPTPATLATNWNSCGICASFVCPATGAASTPWRYTYCGTWAEQSKVGSRIQTIQKAKDPLKSLQTLPDRITILPLSDPQFACMPKDFK